MVRVAKSVNSGSPISLWQAGKTLYKQGHSAMFPSAFERTRLTAFNQMLKLGVVERADNLYLEHFSKRNSEKRSIPLASRFGMYALVGALDSLLSHPVNKAFHLNAAVVVRGTPISLGDCMKTAFSGVGKGFTVQNFVRSYSRGLPPYAALFFAYFPLTFTIYHGLKRGMDS